MPMHSPSLARKFASKGYYPTAVVAEAAGVSTTSVTRWARAGKVKHVVALDGNRYVSWTSVLALLPKEAAKLLDVRGPKVRKPPARREAAARRKPQGQAAPAPAPSPNAPHATPPWPVPPRDDAA